MDYIKQVWASSGVVRALVCFIAAGCALALATAERPPAEDVPPASTGVVDRVRGWLPWGGRPTIKDRADKTAGRILDHVDRGLDKVGQVFDRAEQRSGDPGDSRPDASSDSPSR